MLVINKTPVPGKHEYECKLVIVVRDPTNVCMFFPDEFGLLLALLSPSLYNNVFLAQSRLMYWI